MLQYFCDEMTHSEVETMKFLAGTYVAKNKLQDVDTAQSLFVILEKAQVKKIMFSLHAIGYMCVESPSSVR